MNRDVATMVDLMIVFATLALLSMLMEIHVMVTKAIY